MKLALPLCFLSLIILQIFASDFELLKILDDLITYKIVFKENSELKKIKELGFTDENNWVKIKSSDEEEYTCLLPFFESNVIFKIFFNNFFRQRNESSLILGPHQLNFLNLYIKFLIVHIDLNLIGIMMYATVVIFYNIIMIKKANLDGNIIWEILPLLKQN